MSQPLFGETEVAPRISIYCNLSKGQFEQVNALASGLRCVPAIGGMRNIRSQSPNESTHVQQGFADEVEESIQKGLLACP
jgi:hypothetical protein